MQYSDFALLIMNLVVCVLSIAFLSRVYVLMERVKSILFLVYDWLNRLEHEDGKKTEKD